MLVGVKEKTVSSREDTLKTKLSVCRRTLRILQINGCDEAQSNELMQLSTSAPPSRLPCMLQTQSVRDVVLQAPVAAAMTYVRAVRQQDDLRRNTPGLRQHGQTSMQQAKSCLKSTVDIWHKFCRPHLLLLGNTSPHTKPCFNDVCKQAPTRWQTSDGATLVRPLVDHVRRNHLKNYFSVSNFATLPAMALCRPHLQRS